MMHRKFMEVPKMVYLNVDHIQKNKAVLQASLLLHMANSAPTLQAALQ